MKLLSFEVPANAYFSVIANFVNKTKFHYSKSMAVVVYSRHDVYTKAYLFHGNMLIYVDKYAQPGVYEYYGTTGERPTYTENGSINIDAYAGLIKKIKRNIAFTRG